MSKSTELRAEIRSPIEILANVIYLTKHHADDAEKVSMYMGIATEALAKLVMGLTPQSEGSSDTGE